MEPIFQAALDGNEAEVARLVEENWWWTYTQIEEEGVLVGDQRVDGCTALVLAAWRGHDAVVSRLLALGVDMEMHSRSGMTAAHLACKADRASTLALLLDAGALINYRGGTSWTPLMTAAASGATDCVALLIARGRHALDVDAEASHFRGTALYIAAHAGNAEIVLLLQGGADPTIRDKGRETPLDLARARDHQPCIALLEASLIASHHTRALLKACTLLDAAHAIEKADRDGQKDGLNRLMMQRAALAAAPPYLKRRIEQARELPCVRVHGSDEQLVACVKYALGLEGGGGVVLEGQKPSVGMVKEVFVELCEMLVPKWDRKNV